MDKKGPGARSLHTFLNQKKKNIETMKTKTNWFAYNIQQFFVIINSYFHLIKHKNTKANQFKFVDTLKKTQTQKCKQILQQKYRNLKKNTPIYN